MSDWRAAMAQWLSGSVAQGCLTVLGIAPWDHIVGFSRIEVGADGDFQLRESGVRPWWEVAAEPGAGVG